jgi:hypothetical protein
MLSFALTVALAAPCGIPKPHHAHHAAEPAQTCVAPVVPMCFRDPPPDVDLEPMPNVRPYYINTPVIDDESGEGVWIETTYEIGSIGGVETLTSTPGGYIPPTGTRVPPTARAPEISGQGAACALTLLLGSIAIAKGRTK